MLYVLFNKDLPVKVTDESPYTGTPALKKFDVEYDRVESRWDWKSLEQVELLAMRLTAMTGSAYIGIDNGPAVSPRFEVMELPKIGDEVSYGFNGDYYPDGKIVSMTKKFMITTSTGNTYRRRGNSGSWKRPGGTWGLVKGHHDERNPHF